MELKSAALSAKLQSSLIDLLPAFLSLSLHSLLFLRLSEISEISFLFSTWLVHLSSIYGIIYGASQEDFSATYFTDFQFFYRFFCFSEIWDFCVGGIDKNMLAMAGLFCILGFIEIKKYDFYWKILQNLSRVSINNK